MCDHFVGDLFIYLFCFSSIVLLLIFLLLFVLVDSNGRKREKFEFFRISWELINALWCAQCLLNCANTNSKSNSFLFVFHKQCKTKKNLLCIMEMKSHTPISEVIRIDIFGFSIDNSTLTITGNRIVHFFSSFSVVYSIDSMHRFSIQTFSVRQASQWNSMKLCCSRKKMNLN